MQTSGSNFVFDCIAMVFFVWTQNKFQNIIYNRQTETIEAGVEIGPICEESSICLVVLLVALELDFIELDLPGAGGHVDSEPTVLNQRLHALSLFT